MTAVLERSTTIPEPSRHHPPGPDFPTIAPPTAMLYFAGVLLVVLAAIAILSVGRAAGRTRIAQAVHQRGYRGAI